MSLIYPAIKFLAYSFWCYWGLRNFRPALNDLYTRSLLFGFLRLVMGLFFGLAIWMAGALILSRIGFGLPQNILAYLLIYVPVRWIEWSIMAALIVPDSFSFVQWISGTSPPDRNWRVVGIAISCLADIPLIISFRGIIPTGRILC